MGRAGNRKGFKAYSINTTVRNPARNKDFLTELFEYNDKIFNNEMKNQYYKKLVRKGIYKLSNVDENIKNKYRSGEELTEQEVSLSISKNPQATRDTGRVVTQIRSLKDQGFIKFVGTRNKYKIVFTKLGLGILDQLQSETDIYTKSMIGLQWGSIARDTAFNRANPFLNTLFTINELRKNIGNDKFKGITFFEFAVFILTMKDCNYKLAAKNIVDYRDKYGFDENKSFASNFINNIIDILPLEISSLIGDYSDDVYRKFRMTGLISTRGNGRFIDFNKNELEKVELILEKFINYEWIEFQTLDSYYEYIEQIELPWENNYDAQYRIIQKKALDIDYKLDFENKSIQEVSEEVDRLYYQHLFEEAKYDYDNNLIIKELLMLNDNKDDDSQFSNLAAPLRLEWLVSLFLANKFGRKETKANLILDGEGLPITSAPGGMADIELEYNNYYYTIEVTMIKNRQQQLNAETTTVARHLLLKLKEKNVPFVGGILVAPYIHYDTIDFYRFKTISENIPIVPLSINAFINIMNRVDSVAIFNDELLKVASKLRDSDIETYQADINDLEYYT